MNKMELGIYIHIPFCVRKCNYCDFISYANKQEKIETYINCMIKEIDKFDFENFYITTIYIGGGTPSFIDEKYIKLIAEKIKSKIDLKTVKEFTIEVNPGSADKEKLKEYKEFGINRLSIGLQSTDNKLLKEIGRIHTFEEFYETYMDAKSVGFENINVDLMIGLPNQTIENVQESVKKVIELEPKHISTYSLIVEEGTVMASDIKQGLLKLPEDDIEREMYWYVKKTLESNGYIHYEISNFVKKGFESKHNMNCWEQKQYIGFGISAHSYIDNVRFANTNILEEYCTNFDKKIIEEKQTIEDMQKEYMILGLRKISGIEIKKFKEKFSINPIMLYRKELEKLIKQNLIQIDGDVIKLTNKGIDFANIVWEEFV